MAQWTTTYGALVDLLKVYVEDDSAEYQLAVTGCINRAEERILRDLDLSVFNVATSTTTSTSGATTSKPSQESPVHNILLTASGTHAERRSRDYVQAHGGSGRPLYFYDDQTLIYWAPVPDAAYAIDVMQIIRPQPLSESFAENWISRNAADLLLWASLIESESFLIAPERISEFDAKYASCLGPMRAAWRANMQTSYEPINPTPAPQQTR